MNEIWRNLDGPPEEKKLWTYVVKFEFSRPKSSYLIRPYNINIFDKIIFFKYRTRQIKATDTNK